MEEIRKELNEISDLPESIALQNTTRKEKIYVVTVEEAVRLFESKLKEEAERVRLDIVGDKKDGELLATLTINAIRKLKVEQILFLIKDLDVKIGSIYLKEEREKTIEKIKAELEYWDFNGKEELIDSLDNFNTKSI